MMKNKVLIFRNVIIWQPVAKGNMHAYLVMEVTVHVSCLD